MISQIGGCSDKVSCTCVFDKGDAGAGWYIDIVVWWAAWGVMPKRLAVLSWYRDLEVMGHEFVDESLAWPDVIAYAEAKWRGLQKET